MRRRILVVVATIVALGALAVPAPAAVTLKGTVTGTPYVVAKRTAVPVLLTSGSTRKAKLRSPAGVILLPRTSTVKITTGRIIGTVIRQSCRHGPAPSTAAAS